LQQQPSSTVVSAIAAFVGVVGNAKEIFMQAHTNRVLEEVRTAIGQAQHVLDSGLSASRRVGAGLRDGRDRAIAFEQQAVRSAREAADELDRYAHEHPWRVLLGGIALAAFVATALTLIASSKRD
jgi:ElaB/YqjD/DUF883 family membrane-anchored ribosome-binding protein